MGTKIYPAGSLHCDKCGTALPEIECWYGRKHFSCGGPGCATPWMRPLLRMASRPCSNPSCPGTVPERLSSVTTALHFCTKACESRYWYQLYKSVPVRCAYCGKELLRTPSNSDGPCFCVGHYNLQKSVLRDRDECGDYIELFNTYIKGFGEKHYENLYPVRCELRQFFKFLPAAGIADIALVIPKTIKKFLARPGQHDSRADYIKTFFDWLRRTGRYSRTNPVLSRVQYKRRPRNQARPYGEQTMAQIWQVLDERGTTQAKLALAFGEDFGPRGIDMCKVLRSDIDWSNKTIRITSKKSKQIGWVPYGAKTEFWLKAWLSERPQHLGHDFLFVNARGGRLRRHSLTYLLNSILLKVWRNQVRKNGLDRFNFHRVRHTNTTKMHAKGIPPKTNMKVHLWAHEEMVYHYAGLSEEEILAEMAGAYSAEESLPDRGSRVRLLDFINEDCSAQGEA